MDNLDQEVQDPADERPTPKTFAERVNDRRADPRLALTLQRTYEFDVGGQKPRLSDDDPIVHHSWVNLVREMPKSMLTRDFQLSRHKDAVLTLPIGVTAVLGRAGSGKTRLTREFIYQPGSKVHYFKMFEPGLDDGADNPEIHNPLFEVDLAVELAEVLMADDVDTIIIDSFRYLFYSTTGGATGKGGVNMSLFMALTHLDRVAASLGKRVIVVINPMTDDEVAFNFYIEAAVGAVAAVVVMENWLSARYTHRFAPTRDFRSVKLPADPSAQRAREPGQRMRFNGGNGNNLRNDIFDRKER